MTRLGRTEGRRAITNSSPNLRSLTLPRTQTTRARHHPLLFLGLVQPQNVPRLFEFSAHRAYGLRSTVRLACIANPSTRQKLRNRCLFFFRVLDEYTLPLPVCFRQPHTTLF